MVWIREVRRGLEGGGRLGLSDFRSRLAGEEMSTCREIYDPGKHTFIFG